MALVEQAIVAAGLGSLDIIDLQFVTSMWVVAGALTLAAIALGWRLRRHRAVATASAGFCAVLMLVVATASSVNRHYAYLPTINDALQSVTGDRQWHRATTLASLDAATLSKADVKGMVVRFDLPDDPSNGFSTTTNIVYLPPQYFTHPTARFPVVYLFHGSPGRAADWFHGGRAASEGRKAAAAGRPAILVAAQMSRSWTDDPECVNGVHEKVESHFVKDVLPAIDKRFRTQRDRSGRVFAGMSAGGYCALNLGLRHRDLAATIIDMSGDTVPTHDGGAATLFGTHNPDAARLVAANSPALYAHTLSVDPPTRIWLDSGTSDPSIERQMAVLAPQLRARGLTVVWRVRPGSHTYSVWTAALREALPWALGGPPGHSHDPSRPGPGPATSSAAGRAGH